MHLLKNINSVLAGSLLLIAACKRPAVSVEELENYLLQEKNGLTRSSLENGIMIQTVFRPGSLIAYQEIKNNANVSGEKTEILKKKYNDTFYFTVNITKDDQDPLYQLGDQGQYSAAVKQLAFGLSEKAFLVTSEKDTIRVGDYVFPHMYGMSDAVSVMFAFPMREQKFDWIEFELKDPGFHTGDRKFHFEHSDINNIPELEFSSINNNSSN